MIYNIGDRVRITDKYSFYYNWVGTVNKIINKSQLYVCFDSGKRSWFNGNHDVELFCRCYEKENNMSRFKVGDRVEVIKPDHKYYGRIGVVDDVIDICGHYTIYVKFYGLSSWATESFGPDDIVLVPNPINRYLEKSVGLPRSSGRYPWNDSNNIPKIKKVIFNYPATIVIFEDGTKSVVKIDKDDTVWDPEHGLAMALVKRVYGTNKSHSNYYDIFKKWLPKEEKTEDNNPCTNCPDRKTGCLTNCKKMQDYADECYNKTKKIEDDRVKEIEKKFGEKVRAMREKNKPEEVKNGFIGDFYFKKDYHAQMFPKEFLQFCIDNGLVFYLDDGKDTMIDPDNISYVKIASYLNNGKLASTMKQKYVCGTKFHGWRPSIAVDVNYVVFSKKQQ